MSTHLLRTGGLLVLAGVAACGDMMPAAPLRAPASPSLSVSTAARTAENVIVSPGLAELNKQLASMGAKVRIAKAELLMYGKTWNGVSSTLVIANDRLRGIGTEWVKGDPLRGKRTGVNYQVNFAGSVLPFMKNPSGGTPAQASVKLLDDQIEEAMDAWRAQSCSNARIERVPVPTGTNPNFVDDLVLGRSLASYVQTADIVQGGWQPLVFFQKLAVLFGGKPEDGNSIIGITLTFSYVDDNGTPANPDDDFATDIDRNGKQDIGLAEIYYNAGFLWDNRGLIDLQVMDFYSIIAHETGHSLGLGHFGKVFITGPDVDDNGDGVPDLSLSEVKYAPRALMNAVYIVGRNEIAGTDKSSFCQLWASDNVRFK